MVTKTEFKVKRCSDTMICVFRGSNPIVRTTVSDNESGRISLNSWIERKVLRDEASK